MPVQATWNGTVIAESDDTVIVEGNHYFPPQSIKKNLFKKTDRTSMCFWKGQASYYDLEVEGNVNRGAAWYYPDPSEAAKNIKNYVAFWNGVQVQQVAREGEEAGVRGAQRVTKQSHHY